MGGVPILRQGIIATKIAERLYNPKSLRISGGGGCQGSTELQV